LRQVRASNIVIAVEDIGVAGQHANSERATALVGLAAADGHELWISNATHDDVARAPTEALRHARALQLRRYQCLERITALEDLRERAGYRPGPLSANDTADLELLAALDRNAVDLLITEDGGLRGHAERAGFGSSALSIADAHLLLQGLTAREQIQRPTVSETTAYAVDSRDPIFESLRADYGDHDPPFDAWWGRCQRQHRTCFVITSADGLDALCVLKHERDDTWSLPDRVLSICLFKVADHAMGGQAGRAAA
jgi:hypothetical protein